MKTTNLQHWNDYKLTWDPKLFGGIRDVRFSGNYASQTYIRLRLHCGSADLNCIF